MFVLFPLLVPVPVAPAAAAVPATDALTAQSYSRSQSQSHEAVFIELHPGTIQAGLKIEIRASCGKDQKPATVRSRAFGEIRVVPHHRELRGSVTVPADTPAGEYRVDLRCDSGKRARAELIVLEMKRPSRGPDTGGGGTATAAGDDAAATGPMLLAGAGLAALAAGAGLMIVRWRRAG